VREGVPSEATPETPAGERMAARITFAEPPRTSFDPGPKETLEGQREKLRGRIAVGLVVVFALAIAASFFLFWWFPDKTADLKDFLPLVLTPLTSVVSAVVGFYYGAQTRRGD